MNRRSFFKLSVGGIATAAAVSREWPFKVFSFPKDVVIAKTADVDRAARRILDPIVSMALDGSNAYFFSGLVRRPTREEFEEYMGMKDSAIAKFGGYQQGFMVREVRTKIVDQYGAEFPLPDLPVFHPGGDV